MMYVRCPLLLRNVEDMLHKIGIEISHETVRFWWNRFGAMVLPRSGENASKGCVHTQIGNGTWMYYS